MKKLITLGILTFVFGLVFAFAVKADSPRPHRPDVVVEEPASYVLNATWVSGFSQDGGAKAQALKLGDGGDFAYYAFENWWDHNLSDVTKVRASFMPALGTVNLGGSPRFSLMLDANGDGFNDLDDGTVDPGDVDVNVFLDPVHCGNPVAGGWVESNFTGDKTDCAIFDSTGATYMSDADGLAWGKLVAAYPDAKVWFMFLIQDASTGANYVDRIMLDSAFFTKQP